MIVGPPNSSNGNHNNEAGTSIETKLVIRYHCKHGKTIFTAAVNTSTRSQFCVSEGVIKTHTINMNIPEDDLAPNVPAKPPSSTAKIVVGPGVIKGLLEHFGGMGGKQDPQLHWEFGTTDVKVKSVNAGSKG
jgi:hypothetical protein